MKIVLQKKKLVLWLCAVLVIISTGFMVLIFHVQRQNLSKTKKESLQVLADEKASQVSMFLESKTEVQKIIASMNVFKEAVLYPNDPAKLAIAKKRIEELKDIIPRIAIFTNDGIMFIAESGPVPIDYSAIPYFVSKDKKIMFMRYYDNYQKRDYYSVLGPIYDGTEKNKVIGAIAFDVELDKISALMRVTTEGKNNEVYLINEQGLLLSSSKYIGKGNKSGVLIQEIKSEGAKECLEDLEKYNKDGTIEDHEEEILQYTNYMGNEVFGTHAYVPGIMGCVIAEVSTKEVLGIFDVK